MKRIVVLAMHGVPPKDLPPVILAECMRLHHQTGHAHPHPAPERLRELDRLVGAWPRTPGGEHAEHDIPAAIEGSRAVHPAIRFVDAWPMPLPATARFLADHVRRSAASPLP